jgi:hypothetical protein
MTVTWYDGIQIQVLAGFSAAGSGFGVWGTSLWGTGTWGPETVFTDISAWVRSIQTDRGFSRSVQDWNAGTATLVLKNQDGRFSPSNPASPYMISGITGIRPWRPIVINIEGTPIFTGYAISWQETYQAAGPRTGGATMTVRCVDEMASLARFDGVLTVPIGGGEPAGDRIHRILDNAGHTGLRDIDIGRVTLQPTVHDQNAVTEMKLVSDSEGGALYVERDGAVVFDDRYHLVEHPDSSRIQATFGDGGWPSVLRLTGGSTSTPDHTSLAITGDIDIRAHLSMDNWVPGGFGVLVISQWTGGASNNGWLLGITPDGRPQLQWSPDGTSGAVIARTSTEVPTFSNGTFQWVRVTLDVNNGAGSHDVRFYTSADGSNWTQLGGVVNGAGTTSIFNSTANVAISTILPFTGNVRYAEVRNGIGGTVAANPDFSLQIPGSTTLIDSTGKTWTRSGNANIVDDLTAPAELPYSDISPSYDGADLVNIVALSRAATDEERDAQFVPPAVTVQDVTSRSLYGDSRYARDDLVVEADSQLAGLGDFILAAAKDPELRIDQISFPPRNRSLGQATHERLVSEAVNRKVRDKIRVIRRPPGATATTGEVIVRDCHIAGISHSIDQSGEWQVTWDLISATVYGSFVSYLWDTATWDDSTWFF